MNIYDDDGRRMHVEDDDWDLDDEFMEEDIDDEEYRRSEEYLDD